VSDAVHPYGRYAQRFRVAGTTHARTDHQFLLVHGVSLGEEI